MRETLKPCENLNLVGKRALKGSVAQRWKRTYYLITDSHFLGTNVHSSLIAYVTHTVWFEDTEMAVKY